MQRRHLHAQKSRRSPRRCLAFRRTRTHVFPQAINSNWYLHLLGKNRIQTERLIKCVGSDKLDKEIWSAARMLRSIPWPVIVRRTENRNPFNDNDSPSASKPRSGEKCHVSDKICLTDL